MGIVLAIVGLLVGGVIGYAMNGGDSETVSTSSDPVAAFTSQEAATRAALNNALREHVAVSAVALRSAANGSADTDAALANVDANSVEVAGLIGSVYGEEAQATFLESWRSHIGFFVDYLNGKLAGDEAAQQQALDDLAGYAQAAGAFFEGANPEYLPADAVAGMIAMHRDLVIEVIDLYAAGDIAGSYAAEIKAIDHMNGFADTLGEAIFKQAADQE